ncbi:hypothetical protein GCM10023200_01690 [Actinomycetospora chlora]|uniref:Uncharacterized protein n=1 Tax=Actinomycetospora chlora TaxID=663608 RepID=A0ABP9A2Z4_9PSEU
MKATFEHGADFRTARDQPLAAERQEPCDERRLEETVDVFHYRDAPADQGQSSEEGESALVRVHDLPPVVPHDPAESHKPHQRPPNSFSRGKAVLLSAHRNLDPEVSTVSCEDTDHVASALELTGEVEDDAFDTSDL